MTTRRRSRSSGTIRRGCRGCACVVAPDGVSARPTRVRVEAAGRSRTVDVGSDGEVTIDRVRTTAVTVTVLDSTGPSSADTSTGGLLRAPVAVSEVEVLGGPAATPVRRTRTDLGCGFGPSLSVDGEPVATRLRVSAVDLLSGDPVRATACGPVRLTAGETAVEVPGSFLWSVLGLVLERGTMPGRAARSAAGEGVLEGAPVATMTTSVTTGPDEGVLAGTWPAAAAGVRPPTVALSVRWRSTGGGRGGTSRPVRPGWCWTTRRARRCGRGRVSRW